MTPSPTISFAPLIDSIANIDLVPWVGHVTQMVGLLIASRGPAVSIGDFCEVHTSSGRIVRSQVIGFRDGQVLSMPLDEIDGLKLGDSVVGRKDDARLKSAHPCSAACWTVLDVLWTRAPAFAPPTLIRSTALRPILWNAKISPKR